MGRIRTIKPEFFRHEGLFEAEQETGLPLRLAFAGLWTACDREGRFEWKPRAIKLDVMPWDELDFSRVLDALVTRGFVVKYAVGGKDFGAVPSWSKHQVVNHREKASELPEIPHDTENAQQSTREPRVNDASTTRHGNARGEGEGEREEEGEKKEEQDACASDSNSQPESLSTSWTPDRLWEAVTQAVGLTSGRIPTHWLPPAATIHAWRWVTDLKLDPEAIVDAARTSRQQHPEPPNGPKALDGVMSRLAAAINAPPPEAIPTTFRPIGVATPTRLWTLDPNDFDDQGNRIHDRFAQG